MIFLDGLSDSLFIEHLSCEKNLDLGDMQINKDLFLSSMIGRTSMLLPTLWIPGVRGVEFWGYVSILKMILAARRREEKILVS